MSWPGDLDGGGGEGGNGGRRRGGPVVCSDLATRTDGCVNISVIGLDVSWPPPPPPLVVMSSFGVGATMSVSIAIQHSLVYYYFSCSLNAQGAQRPQHSRHDSLELGV